MSSRYEVSVRPLGEGVIESRLDFVADATLGSIREQISRQVIDTREAKTREALISLGWRPPGEIAAIDIPIGPDIYDPSGQRYRRVTATDVMKMEHQLAKIRQALK